MDCLFCKIINGEIPSKTIYEDELVKVFLDISPCTNGHSLIVPKEHLKDFRDVNEKLLLHIHEIINKLYPIYKEKLHCEGLTICNNTEYGQEIKHYHIHLIPRYSKDNVHLISNKQLLKDLDEIANILMS